MRARPTYLIALALLAAALLAGCGGGSSSTQAPASIPTVPGANTSAAGEAAVTACKQAVQAQSVSASVKSKLEGICQKAASGNTADVKKAAQEACEEIANSTVPAGPAREQVLASCKHK